MSALQGSHDNESPWKRNSEIQFQILAHIRGCLRLEIHKYLLYRQFCKYA